MHSTLLNIMFPTRAVKIFSNWSIATWKEMGPVLLEISVKGFQWVLVVVRCGWTIIYGWVVDVLVGGTEKSDLMLTVIFSLPFSLS